MNKFMQTLLPIIIVFFTSVMFSNAQQSSFKYPTWHPTQNLIAVTNGLSIHIYTSDFSNLVNQFLLVNTPDIQPLVKDMQWSPDGTKIAISLYGEGISPLLQIWNTQTAQKIFEIINIDIDSYFSWYSNSESLVLGYSKSMYFDTIRIYDVTSGALTKEINLSNKYQSLSTRLNSSNQILALYLVGKEKGLHFLNLSTELLTKLPVNLISDSTTPRYVFSPNGIKLAGLENWDDSFVTIIDTSSFQSVGQLIGHNGYISNIIWNTQNIVTVGYDNTIRFWNPQTLVQERLLVTGGTSSLSFNPDSSLFVSSADNLQQVVVRNSISGTIVATLNDTIVPPTPTITFNHRGCVGQ